MRLRRSLQNCVELSIVLLVLTVGLGAQSAPPTGEGSVSGNYVVHQSVEVGYRNTDVSGNLANYNTFVNLNTGVRLFEQSLDIRSINHAGPIFDTLSMQSFGYGGDPNDVTRLRIGKHKWYDFNASFRRDRYPWNYSLLANPLNPANSTPSLPITDSLHSMNVVRRMSDFNLTLLPQSRVRFRLGYTRNIQEGPSSSSIAGATILDPIVSTTQGFGTQTQLFQNWKTSLNAYRLGVDFQILRKTSIHYDQFLQYFKQDTSYADRNFNFQSNGVPVDLGVVFDTVNAVPCAPPIQNAGTTPPTANPACNGYVSYTRTGRPRGSLPTEQFSFQSESIKNVSMSGRAAYSSGVQNSNDLNELFYGNNVNVLQVATQAKGPTHAKRIVANADWAATWSVTPNFRLVDSFTYDRFQLPGTWGFTDISLFAAAPLGSVTPSCLPPFTAGTGNCPATLQHNADSGPDISTGTWFRYLGQNFKSNTIQVEYDFARRAGARLGYRYGNRKVFTQDDELVANEVFLPDAGPVGSARGDCASTPDPTVVCTASPGNIGPTTHVQGADITSHSLLSGLWARPSSNLRLNFGLELFWADSAFTRSDPRQQQRYRFQAAYTPSRRLSLDASFDILEHRNGMLYVNDREHDRSFSLGAVLTPNDHFSFDLGYTYDNIYVQLIECWAFGSNVTPPVPPSLKPPNCPVPGGLVAVALGLPDLQGGDVTAFGGPAQYSSNTHFAYGDVNWKPVKRLTLRLGYAGSFANGRTLFLNPNAPVGPLQYAYQKPYAGFILDLAKGLAFKTNWTYYGYNPRSIANPPGLAPIGSQDFNANNVTLAFRYSF
jgi:hypothetical protein